ncbi:hypothetical protein [Phyllobacterium sp.]
MTRLGLSLINLTSGRRAKRLTSPTSTTKVTAVMNATPRIAC